MANTKITNNNPEKGPISDKSIKEGKTTEIQNNNPEKEPISDKSI